MTSLEGIRVIDLRSAGGMAVLHDLMLDADLPVESFRAGIGGFGQDGPLADKQCFDGVAQAMSGLVDLTGQADGSPTMIGFFVCADSAGLYAALGAAPPRRRRRDRIRRPERSAVI